MWYLCRPSAVGRFTFSPLSISLLEVLKAHEQIKQGKLLTPSSGACLLCTICLSEMTYLKTEKCSKYWKLLELELWTFVGVSKFVSLIIIQIGLV